MSERNPQKENDKKSFLPWDPGTEDVSVRILKYLGDGVKTFKEYDTKSPSMYLWVAPKPGLKGKLSNPENGGIYIMGEPDIQTLAERTYKEMINEMIDIATELLKDIEPETDAWKR